MSQIREGVVDVTNGSATVIGTDTEWETVVESGDLFIVRGDLVSYEVANVVSDTELELSAPYAGDTEEAADYVIHSSFTPNKNYPFPERGDVETANVVKQAIKKIDDGDFVEGPALDNLAADFEDHSERHESGGDDEISVEGLSGRLSDSQDADTIHGRDVEDVAPSDGDIFRWNDSESRWEVSSDLDDYALDEDLQNHIEDDEPGVHGTGTAAFVDTGTAPENVPTNADLRDGVERESDGAGDNKAVVGFRIPGLIDGGTSPRVILLSKEYGERRVLSGQIQGSSGYSLSNPSQLINVSMSRGSDVRAIAAIDALKTDDASNPIELIRCTYDGEEWLAIHFQGSRNLRNYYFTGISLEEAHLDMQLLEESEVSDITIDTDSTRGFFGRPGDPIGTGNLMPGSSNFETVLLDGAEIMIDGNGNVVEA